MDDKQHQQLTINQKVVHWAHGHLGKPVKIPGGKAECWDLAEKALQQAGAQTSTDLGPVGADTNYIWGEPIKDIKDVEPGDMDTFTISISAGSQEGGTLRSGNIQIHD